MSKENLRFDTLQQHAGHVPYSETGSRAVWEHWLQHQVQRQ